MNISDAELLRRAVEHPKGWRIGHPRWAAIGDLFALGSTYSTELCVRFGINPHEIKKRKTGPRL